MVSRQQFVLVQNVTADAPCNVAFWQSTTSFAYDFCVEQTMAGGVTLNFFIVEQVPTLSPDAYSKRCGWDRKQTLEQWISERVLKLRCARR